MFIAVPWNRCGGRQPRLHGGSVAPPGGVLPSVCMGSCCRTVSWHRCGHSAPERRAVAEHATPFVQGQLGSSVRH
jgi:hypothetical protein